MAGTWKQRMRRAMGAIGLAMITTGAGLMGGCVTNEATGTSRLALGYMSREQQIAIGAEAAPELTVEYGGRTPSEPIQAYITEVGRSLAQRTEGDNPSLPWEFTLLDSPVINAFALPGGKVFMSRGLAEKFTNEAQLAGVLGHEIGHVTAEHVAERIQAYTGATLLAQILGAAAGAGGGSGLGQITEAIVGVGGQGYLLKFGRSQELQADELGMRYMARAGYDPVAQRQVMEILSKAAEGPRPPEFLSTHPHPDSRIAQIDELLATTYRDISGRPTHQLHADRFKRRFLDPISKLPPAKADADRGLERFAWCSICNPSSP